MLRLTDLDRRLISALRKDGRVPIAVLAEQLGIARGTVTNRIERLKSHGVIVGFSVRTRDYDEGERIRAISFIEVVGRTTDRVIGELRGFPEIIALHTTNGGGIWSQRSRARAFLISTRCYVGCAASKVWSTVRRACYSVP